MYRSQSIRKTMSSLDWTLLIVLSLLWGGSFFLTEIALLQLPSLVIVASRLWLAAIFLFIFLCIIGQKLPTTPSIWLAFLGMGVLNNAIPFTLIVWGQSHIASGLASILNATTPMFTVVIAHFFTQDEKMSGHKFVGVIIGFVGVAIMIGGKAFDMFDFHILAQLACLGAALSYGFAGVFGKRFQRMGVSPMATATGQVMASSLVLLPLVLFFEPPWQLPLPNLSTLSAVIGLAVFSTALAYILYFRILATVGATNLLLVTFLIPVSAILLGVFFLNEVLLARQLVGMLIIGVGLAVLDGRLFQNFHRIFLKRS